jgi:DNA recombination protein RmuC
MEKIVIVIAGRSVTWGEAVLGLLAALLVLLFVLGVALWRMARQRAREAADALERQGEIEERMENLGRQQSEMTGRVQTIGDVFGARQSDLVRLIAERLDSLQNRVGDNLQSNVRQTVENLSKLNERLAVIDAAQKNLTSLTSEVLSLKDVLSNKQARGAFGQGRMEAIVRDGLPPNAYEFQPTLANGKRPDCVIRLPGDDRPLVVDAKFPLEGFTAFREAQSDDLRKSAMQRVRSDVGTHLKDIAEKYLQPGETQDIAVLFVPSESVFADLQEHFDDVVQRAHRLRVLVVSPSLLMMAIQVMQAIVRDARMREQAHQIQTEVQRLLADLVRLRERVGKLDTHFRQAQEDVVQITVSADKVAKRGERIEAMEFQDTPGTGASDAERMPSPLMRGAAAAE